MKKVWVYKRTGIKGWWVGWYESGKRKAKALPSKRLAEHYCQLKYSQLNSDVFTGIMTISWEQMVEEYRETKKVQGVTEATLYETALTLRHFERLIGKCNSKQISQNSIDKFVLERGQEIKRTTLNKDIRNLRTFINWCREKRYLNGTIKIKELKEEEKPVKSLNDAQIKKLMSVTEYYPTMKIRILLALGTGLRLGDIQSLNISDINFENNSITTSSRKTRKSMGTRPVSSIVMTELSKYVCELDPGQEKLFNDNFSHKRWRKLCQKAGLADLKFHDLRKTFGSMLAQNGISTAVTQKLLEHSSSRLTNKVYTNVDPVLRHAVEQLPVGEWL
ncbi:MAG: site-specific integrase [Planctomycetota bacterium]|nr:MAG: site-specific integrase [Planctomycetota bacterium]